MYRGALLAAWRAALPAAVLAAASGCYAPTAPAGAPCGASGACPTPLVCVDDRCVAPATTDAAVTTDAALPDAPPGDASPFDGPPGGWAAPTPIPGVNTDLEESDPSLSPDRLTIVFERAGDLMIGTRAAADDPFTVVALDAVNSLALEKSPDLSPDGATLYFVSERLVAGEADVYVATRSAGAWQAPTRVAELSTATDDDDVAIAPDGLTAWLKNGGGIRRATRAAVTDAWGTPVATGANFGTGEPAGPAVTASGDLYFHAGAPRDLFVARRLGGGFLPRAAIAELSSAEREAAPHVSADERYLAFERAGDLVETTR